MFCKAFIFVVTVYLSVLCTVEHNKDNMAVSLLEGGEHPQRLVDELEICSTICRNELICPPPRRRKMKTQQILVTPPVSVTPEETTAVIKPKEYPPISPKPEQFSARPILKRSSASAESGRLPRPIQPQLTSIPLATQPVAAPSEPQQTSARSLHRQASAPSPKQLPKEKSSKSTLEEALARRRQQLGHNDDDEDDDDE